METLISEVIYELYVIIKKLISHGKENSNFVRDSYILNQDFINQDFINQNKTCTQIAIYTIEILYIQYYSL